MNKRFSLPEPLPSKKLCKVNVLPPWPGRASRICSVPRRHAKKQGGRRETWEHMCWALVAFFRGGKPVVNKRFSLPAPPSQKRCKVNVLPRGPTGRRASVPSPGGMAKKRGRTACHVRPLSVQILAEVGSRDTWHAATPGIRTAKFLGGWGPSPHKKTTCFFSNQSSATSGSGVWPPWVRRIFRAASRVRTRPRQLGCCRRFSGQ